MFFPVAFGFYSVPFPHSGWAGSVIGPNLLILTTAFLVLPCGDFLMLQTKLFIPTACGQSLPPDVDPQCGTVPCQGGPAPAPIALFSDLIVVVILLCPVPTQLSATLYSGSDLSKAATVHALSLLPM